MFNFCFCLYLQGSNTYIIFVKCFFHLWSRFSQVFEVFSSANFWEIVKLIYFTRDFTSQHFSEADERSVKGYVTFFLLNNLINHKYFKGATIKDR